MAKTQVKHEISIRYLKGDKQWVGKCSAGDFWMAAPTEQTVRANCNLHQQRHGGGA